jgi:hypothetical protein
MQQIREQLRELIWKKLEENGLNLNTVQKVDIKKEWGFPIGISLLIRIASYGRSFRNYQLKEHTAIKLLNFFKIPFVVKNGGIELLKP